jgi:DNA helicase IV
MTTSEIIQREQEFVDEALKARESRRSDRENKYSISDAMARPINTWSGEKSPRHAEIGDKNEDVCFAKVIYEDSEHHYIGKYAIRNDQTDLLVSSWKSKIGALFYRSNINEPLGLAGKCRLLFDVPNHVNDVEENLYKELKTKIENLTRNPESDVSDAVLDELEKGSSGSLKEIIKTIHASQYEIISAKRGGLHVIQGAPGTGKTVVGVHRASWLLFPGNDEDLKAEKTLFVGPNVAFIRYIENVIPSLGDENIVHKDLTKLGPNVVVGAIEKRKIARIKGDVRMKALLIQAIKDRLKIPTDEVVFNPPGQARPIALSAEDIKTKMEQLIDESILGNGRTAYNGARSSFRIWLLNGINAILKESFESESKSSRSTPFLKENDIEAFTERIWPSISPASFLRDFFSSQGRVITAARELDFQIKELLLLERRPSPQISKESWTVADVALLDFLENHIQGTDAFDQYDYIIVDEAQDMTPMQLESIRRRSGTGDILLMGDLAQATGPWVHTNWNEIADCVNKPIERLDELEYGYRVPKQIFEFATKVLSHINPQLKSPRLVRDVKETPVVKIFDDYEELFIGLVEDLHNLGKISSRIGLIVGDDQVETLIEELRNSGVHFSVLENDGPAEGLNIVPVSRQKGLEFDDVILVEPQDIIDIEDIGLRQLYVAVTRSLRGLSIYSIGELPLQLREEVSEFDLDAIIEEFDFVPKDYVQISEFSDIRRDVEGFLRIKGLTLREFIAKIRHNEGE